MGKPTDPGDSTQPLSESMVVPEAKPPPHGIPPGDQSVMWRGTVVSADDFATAPKKKSRAKWIVIGALGAAAVGGGAYGLMQRSSSPSSAGSGSSAIVGSGSGSGSSEAVPAAVPIDAAPPPPVDAAPPPVDAATPDAAAEQQATKPPTKKPPPKKKPPIKKRTH